MNNNTSNTVLPDIAKPKSGATALGVSSFMPSGNQSSAFDIGMGIASAIPDSNVSQAVNAINMVSNAAQAANQGSMLGVGMALAGIAPGSDFANAMDKIGAASNLMSALQSGSPLGIGMALAGIAPGSPLAKVMGQVAEAKKMFDLGMSILKPNMNPADLIKYIQPLEPVKLAAENANIQKGAGAWIKGEGLKCEACALGNQEAMMGAPVNALYGSKILVGGDDIDYSGQGYLPFVMSRIYNSQNPDTGWFGQGWKTYIYEQRLELEPQYNRIHLIDNTGRRVPFTYLAPGQSCYQPYLGITLYRKPLPENKKDTLANARPMIAGATSGTRIGDHEPLEFIIYPGDYYPDEQQLDSFSDVSQHYSYVASRSHYGIKATVLLSSYNDKYGQKNQLHYTHSSLQNDAQIPQYLTDEGGGCYEFEFTTINEHHRLARLYQIEDSLKRIVLAEYSYSKEGNLIKVSKRGQITREFAYKEHLMVWQSQVNGQQVAYQYDRYDNPKAARVIEQSINDGRHYLFEYGRDTSGIDSVGTTLITEQSGTDLERTRQYSYDQWYNMLSLTDPNGNTTRYRYDQFNRISRIIGANHGLTNFNYQGAYLSQTEKQIDFNPITQLPRYVKTNYQHNARGELIATSDGLGNEQKYQHNQKGELIESIDALGHSIRFQYDKHGNVNQQTLANGSQFTFEYNAYGKLISQTDCSGYQTQYSYDNKQRLIQIINAMGERTHYSYDIKAPHLERLVSQVHNPDGSHIQMDYDELGRIITYTDALGQRVHYQYNNNGTPNQRTEDSVGEAASTVKRVNAKGNSIHYHYDTLGRLTTLINENGEQWTFNYDANDNLISETRFDGHQSRYTYDDTNQLTQQIDNPQLSRYKQHHVLMQYNLVGQLLARHSSHYPELIGHETSKPTRAQYHRMRYNYNEIGQLISAANPNSRTNFAYDASGRLIEETLISHLTQEGQYQERSHTLSHDYDELGNRVATTLPDGKVINQLYYGSGHLYNQSLHDPSTDEHIELRHSERNKLHQEISRQQGALSSSYNYDPMGRLIQQQSKTYHTTHGTKYSRADEHITIQRDYNYDALGQLTHLSGHSVLGNQTNQNQQSQFTRNHQYQYDAQGRLTEHKLTDYQNHTGITEVFAFDPASNRVPVQIQSQDGSKDSKQVESVNNKGLAKANEQGRPRELIQNGQRIRYTYDSHGRILYKTTEPVAKDNQPLKQSKNSLFAHRQALQLQYNANNELDKSLRTQYQGNQVIKTLTEYHYDTFGRRIHKHSETRNFTQSKDQTRQTTKTQYKHTHMLWDSDLPIQEYSDTHVYTTIYDQGSFEPVARLMWLRDDIPQAANDESTAEEQRDAEGWYGNNKPAAKTGIQVYHYHNDQLGTPNELTNSQGEVVWLADYEAWGNTAKVVYHSIQIDQIKVSQNELQPIRFQGQYFDIETGLHYNRFRYYDPDMGMFTTRDPIGLRGGDNVFQYAPNPTEWVDPLGLIIKKIRHGQWCGPDWTGGREEPYTIANDRNGHYAAPVGRLDIACQAHDIAYAKCRVDNRCDGLAKENCMINADNVLLAASRRIPANDPNSSTEVRDSLEWIIERHWGTENDIKTCPRYQRMSKWEKFKHDHL